MSTVPLLCWNVPPVFWNDPPIVDVALGIVTVPDVIVKSFVAVIFESLNAQLPPVPLNVTVLNDEPLSVIVLPVVVAVMVSVDEALVNAAPEPTMNDPPIECA
jgi:hypothetical protein